MTQSDNSTEWVIDLWRLVRVIFSRWKLLGLFLCLGAGLGLSLILNSKKVYLSSVSFVQSSSGSDISSMGGMGALSLLGFNAGTSEPPMIKHFEKYLSTLDFVIQLKDSMYKDTSLYQRLLGLDSLRPDAVELFADRVGALSSIRRAEGLVNLEVKHTDPEFAFFLVQAIYKNFYRDFETDRKKSIRDNLGLVEEFVEKTRSELQRATANLRVFLDRNRGFGSPDLEQRRGELMLEVRLAEERYVAAEKEKGILEIRNEKRDQGLTVIERPHVPLRPANTRKTLVLVFSIFLFMVAGVAFIMVLDRKKWLVKVLK